MGRPIEDEPELRELSSILAALGMWRSITMFPVANKSLSLQFGINGKVVSHSRARYESLGRKICLL